MQISKIGFVGLALSAAVIVGLMGHFAINRPRPLLENVGFSPTRITPNADLDTDVTVFEYTLNQNATISVVFTGPEGDEYFFRQSESRIPGEYSVLFSGVVDVPPEEQTYQEGRLETRLLPDGLYTWTMTARTENDDTATATGTLTIEDGDSELPLISAFDVGPTIFTPNQDGIKDRINVNVFLSKPANLKVYLENTEGVQIFLPRREEGRAAGDEGSHEYDYDGGVDQGFRPPSDGTYTLYAVAQDDEGQRFVRTQEIRIENSGQPQVEIMPQSTGGTVCFESLPYQDVYATDAATAGEKIDLPTDVCSDLSTLTFPVGDILVFRLTVRNYGDTPIRTAGPFPGTVYEDTQLASTLGAYEESGAWRVGIECGTSLTSYPWRWALAPLDELEAVFDAESGATYYYLEPGQRAEVWGAVRLTQIITARNPQPCWAGLIHEDVGIATLQNNVGRREIELVPRPD